MLNQDPFHIAPRDPVSATTRRAAVRIVDGSVIAVPFLVPPGERADGDGAPMRLMVRVVEVDGRTPVGGAEVRVSDTNIDRLQAAAGARLTDADGTMTFDGRFPGWSPKRPVHARLVVRRTAWDGGLGDPQTVVSQLVFDEDLTRVLVEHFRACQQDDPWDAAEDAMLAWLVVAVG